MITAFFMGFTDRRNNVWYPIAKMTWDDRKYYTVCLQGILEGMKSNKIVRHIVETKFYDIDNIQVFDEIDIRFGNKMPNAQILYLDRFKPLIEQLRLPGEVGQLSIFEHAARTSEYIFPEVTPDENKIYHFYFENIAIRGSTKLKNYIYQIEIGDKLYIKDNYIYHDAFIVGEAPKYVIDLYFYHLEAVKISVAKVNYSGYYESIICHFEVNGKIIIPFTDYRYQPLLSLDGLVAKISG